MLIRARAGLDDENEFSAFSCCAPNPGFAWVQEVENYIRGALLWHFQNITLAFREEGELVAVSSFYASAIGLPLVEPIEQPSWHLDVLAIRLDHQYTRLATDVFEQTFAEMRSEDPDRILVTGFVHRSNTPSFAACERAGLTRLAPRDDDYWIVLGEVPEL